MSEDQIRKALDDLHLATGIDPEKLRPLANNVSLLGLTMNRATLAIAHAAEDVQYGTGAVANILLPPGTAP